MATTTRARNSAAINSNDIAAQILAKFGGNAKMAMSKLTGYSEEGAPLYDMVQSYGIPSTVINNLDNAFTTHAEVRDALKEGQAAITVSVFEGRDAFSLAVKEGKQIYYFGLMHDKDGNPLTAGTLVLSEVVTNRKFDIPGTDVTLEKGKVMFKALPAEYALKLVKFEAAA